MPRYFDADVLIRKLDTWYKDLADEHGNDDEFVNGYNNAINDISDVLFANVQDIKHGHWIPDDKSGGWQCSECGHATNERMLKWYQEINGDTCNICYQSAKPFYCSRCGVKMDEEENKNE